MTITEKAAYLKGFADAAKLNNDEDIAKVVKKIVEIIDDISLCISDLDDQVESLSEQLDAVDEDLGDLEELIYGDDDCCCDDDDCDCCCDDDCDCCCDEDMMFELECPACGETIYLDASIFDSEEAVTCPACGVELEDLTIEIDDSEE